MKRLLIIAAILLLAYAVFGQFQIDDMAFKSYKEVTYDAIEYADNSFVLDNKVIVEGHTSLFYINDGRMITSLKDQKSEYQFYNTADIYPEYADNLYNGMPGWDFPSIDNGFFNSHVTVYYEGNNKYQIWLQYSNQYFIYYCIGSDERPWDNDPIDYVAEGQKYRTNPEYTEEELESFANKLSDFFGQTITTAMMVTWSINSLME